MNELREVGEAREYKMNELREAGGAGEEIEGAVA